MFQSIGITVLTLAVSVLSIHPALAENSKNATHEGGGREESASGRKTDELDAYSCSIVEYKSENSDDTKNAIVPFQVRKKGPTDSTTTAPRTTGVGDTKIDWRVTRDQGLLSVEARDSTGKVLGISTTSDGSPMGFKIPGTKNILTCNPPNKAIAENCLKTDPKIYGMPETVSDRPRTYPETVIKNPFHLRTNPRAYGATITERKIDPTGENSWSTVLGNAFKNLGVEPQEGESVPSAIRRLKKKREWTRGGSNP